MRSESRFAARALARWCGGVVVAMLTLAAGIGTTTALYAVGRVMLADLSGVPDIQRVARVYAASPALGVERAQVALSEFDSTLNAALPWMGIAALLMSGGVAAIACTLATYRIVRLEPSAVLRRT